MEIKNWTYEEYPDCTALPEGAVRYETTGDEVGIYYSKDIVYAEVDGHPLHLQLLSPVTRNPSDALRPCIVYVQGSGWMPQDCYHNIPKYARLAERGYVIAVVEYRHALIAPFPAQIQDARNAVRYVRMHAAEGRIDPEQIFLAGSSSGGHTAVMASLLDEEDPMDRNLYPGVSAKVCGVLDYYGCVSLMMEDGFPSTVDYQEATSLGGLFLGGVRPMEHPELRKKATAVTYLSSEKKLPPYFIVHGTKDRTVNPMESVEFYEALKACGQDARLIMLGGADHGGAEFWTGPVLDAADEFIQYCISLA